jgi:extracellular elastinolytic metalloproteinase
MPRSCARKLTVLIIGAALMVAPPAGAQSRRAVARPAASKPFLDVRDAQRRAVERRGDVSLRAPSARTRSARGRLRSAGAVVGVDALTGTPRFVAGRSAPLSAPAPGDRREVAERFVRRHLAALGLSRTDLGSLQLQQRTRIPGGAELFGYRQYADGIPSFDGGMRIAVDAAGRVVSVAGAAQPDLSVATDVPTLTAVEAMRRLMDNVGAQRAVHVARGPAGRRRSTQFTSGEAAALVVFGQGTSARLAWQLDLRAAPAAHYAAVVDAASGRILYRANRVKSAANDALVWEQYPGAANGGTAHPADLTPYLFPDATDLSGPYAHAWSDTNDNDRPNIGPDGHIVSLDAPDDGEAVLSSGGSFEYPFSDFTAVNVAGACDAAHRCSWDHAVAGSWQDNREQTTVQAFYYVNRFRDHLLAAPISFRPSDGNFDNGDRILVNTDDGAATGPNALHRDNAYMDTPPDGRNPTMAMFLFLKSSTSPFRDVNGGDDAAVVYHEYTHGLSNRLVTFGPGGEGALNGDQAGAMGEGWSDWYAKDFLVDQFPADDTAAAGEVDMGKFIDSIPHSIRTQGLDCPANAGGSQCPGAGLAGAGGYTYGDFGRIDSGPEVHSDGEIWGETLWDLRAAVGSSVARAIVTQGMRLSPPEPTFLDARDAILAADGQLFRDGDHSGAIWGAFAPRGMGSDALSPTQDTPVEGFKRPPAAALSVSTGSAMVGQPVSFDASASDDDGSVVSYDFDFLGDGSPDIAGTTSPAQSFSYPGAGTFHPRVTVHDDEGETDTAARALQVTVAPTPTPTATPTPTPVSKRPTIVLARTGTKGGVRFTIGCDSACAGTAKLTITRKLAKKLRLGKRRTVGSLRVRLPAAGRKRFTIKLSKRTLRAMRRAGVRRLTTRLRGTVTDAERQRATKGRGTRIRR